MPIYEYVCKECREHFEVLVSLSSTALVKCKKCGSLDVKKTMSASCIKVGGGNSIPSGGLSGCCPSKSGFS